ncbi:NADH-quinone oxidoreductase subunit L [Pelobacter propionicus]|uniref:NADH dehydrogenase subunit L n=1 Tax=Pelobacter propionicus (strain DSM 2379 / NBRC 103807 / OttBd1) TaxID=338966 RepID=A1ALQ0_PELPD|nr:NADH-quinone oxidoreductase subunit L [Pelobacter propionicus]ABK98270.1 NADH dehydrogenase subunit L [Pelobacter propionicus DSM 2379]ABK99249.1 NADH dehydrogenase subunit L [Pelobacter propionicus DSM 2379]ABL00776.1 NADH dehydrogenase subunit L [Pelobacter propionicus DSM 2379]
MIKLTLIPLLPLLGFLFNGLFGNRLPRWVVSTIACGLPALSFLVTLVLYSSLVATGQPIAETLYTWVALDPLNVDVAFYLDQASAVMCLVVTGVGTLIHLYSVGYMSHDEDQPRYFAYLNLFLFFMLMLVLGKNMIMLFAGWEGVGLASYLLIGFWYQDDEKSAAGMKAFIVNRVGDTGFVLAALLIFSYSHTLDFQGINAYFGTAGLPVSTMNLIGILLLIGACGKSAQIPLHVWLPDAMAGPTPVSALIHAATMVTAGVYLLSRMNGVLLQAPGAMQVVMWGGALTAFVGATMGLTQYNLKKVLAYSTMSQIGYMFMACGLGSFSAAMFHLYSHAFFKACLFLGAGAVLHALHGEEDMRKMGGLAKKMPLTFVTFLAGSLALCGVPPFAGFFSKDEILWSAFASAHGGSTALWLVGAVAAGMTSFYMFRAIIMTFFGQDNVPAKLKHGIHEPPFSMAIVLIILGVSSVAAGFIGLPQVLADKFGFGSPFFSFLEPVFGHHALKAGVTHQTELMFMGISIAIALGGIFLAWVFYGLNPALPEAIKKKAGCIYTTISQGYYFDAIYEKVIVKSLDTLSDSVLYNIAEKLLNYVTIVKAGATARYSANLLSRMQSGNVQAYVLYALAGLALIIWWGVANA